MSLFNQKQSFNNKIQTKAASTVGRGKVTILNTNLNFSTWNDDNVALYLGDSLNYYHKWEQPTVIISDGAYTNFL